MPEGVTKEEVNFSLTPNHISIGVCGGSPLIILEGQLYANVQPETSAWKLTSDKRSVLFFCDFIIFKDSSLTLSILIFN